MYNLFIPMLSIGPHGGNRVLLEIANSMSKQGLSVTILTSKIDNNMVYDIDDDIDVVEMFPRVPFKYLRWFLFLSVAWIFMRKGKVLANHFLTAYPSKLSQLIFKTDFIYFIQDIEFEFYKKYRVFGSVLKLLCIFTYRFGNIISANPYLTNRLSEYANVEYDFNLGVRKNCDSYDILLREKKYDIVFFMRSELHKGLDRFIDIYKCNPELNYLCITQDEKLKSTYSDMSGISIISPKSDSELYQYLASSKALLLTSYHEGFALPPLEAMSVGTPLIYYPSGGPGVYSNENNSIAIQRTSDFILAFNEIVSNYQNYSKASLKTANLFDLDKSLKNLYCYIF